MRRLRVLLLFGVAAESATCSYDRAHEVAVGELTYIKLIDRFHVAFAPLV